MVKPDKCSWCGETKFTFYNQSELFNPDTEKEEIRDYYKCDICNTIHVEEGFQRDVDSNKAVQTTNATINMSI